MILYKLLKSILFTLAAQNTSATPKEAAAVYDGSPNGESTISSASCGEDLIQIYFDDELYPELQEVSDEDEGDNSSFADSWGVVSFVPIECAAEASPNKITAVD